MINFNKKTIDTATMSVIKGGRGVVIFVKQMVTYPTKQELLHANKVLNHEEAIELRDFLIEKYPLGDTGGECEQSIG